MTLPCPPCNGQSILEVRFDNVLPPSSQNLVYRFRHGPAWASVGSTTRDQLAPLCELRGPVVGYELATSRLRVGHELATSRLRVGYGGLRVGYVSATGRLRVGYELATIRYESATSGYKLRPPPRRLVLRDQQFYLFF